MAPSSHSLATILLKIVASPPHDLISCIKRLPSPCSHWEFGLPYHILDIAYSPVSSNARSFT
uniref:Uncharacterized protein n=1 Tax=Oryza meridionalis TaxID=40149 RepID=A0A0E0CK75_9ORYZ